MARYQLLRRVQPAQGEAPAANEPPTSKDLSEPGATDRKWTSHEKWEFGLELFTCVQTSGVRFIRNGLEYSGAERAQHLRDKLAKAGDRVKTTEDFITGIASKSFLSGKPYLVKFAGGHTQATGEWLRGYLAEVRENKR